MKKKPLQSKPPEDAVAAVPGDDGRLQSGKGEADGAGLRADSLLAERCLAGEVAAWEQFYEQCQAPLLLAVRIMLGPQTGDANLVDEIAARVWYALVANDGALLAKYNPDRGARLITFMRALAKDEIARYFRTEARRRNREVAALRTRSRRQGEAVGQPIDSLAEFLDTLTPRERAFCSDHLLAQPSAAAEGQHSTASIWQLSHRIRRKLLRFLDFRS